MSAQKMRLNARTDKWDDLTELLTDLAPYTTGTAADLYPVVQAIAEGRETAVFVKPDQVDEFVAHMAEFRIDAQRA